MRTRITAVATKPAKAPTVPIIELVWKQSREEELEEHEDCLS